MSEPASGEGRGSWRRPLAAVVLLVILAAVAYSNTLGNTALFHHVPDACRDAVLDNTMLRGTVLLPKVFSNEFLLATYGEYRPLGYALFAVINGFMPRDGVAGWHVLLILLHLTGAVVIFFTLRMLLHDVAAGGLAAVYLLHPVFCPVINDVNNIYFLWGLLFTLVTVWLFLLHLRTGSAGLLLLSVISFAACAFTYKYAVIVPALLIALCLYHDVYPRGAAALLGYLSLGAFVAALFKVPVLLTLAGAAFVVLLVSVAASPGRSRYLRVLRVAPYLVVIAIFMAISETIETKPLFANALQSLEESHLIEPFQPWFLARRVLPGSVPHMIALGILGGLPALALLRRRYQLVAAALLAFLLIVTVQCNRYYRNNTAYWTRISDLGEAHPGIQLNLATAYIEEGQHGLAADLLMHLCYEKNISGIGKMTAQTKLGKALGALGREKASAYFYLVNFDMGWVYETMKNLLNDVGVFALRKGYLTNAEFCWSSGLVIDPYDVRLYNNLGRVLIYKNFFRAAEKHLLHALALDDDHPTTLYYLALIAKVGGKDKDYALYSEEWKTATGRDTEPDFQPVFDAYRFDRDGMRRQLSDNPIGMFVRWNKRQREKRIPLYTIPYLGKTYAFWEVPMEIGEYIDRGGNYGAALEYFLEAHKVNPESPVVVRRAAEAYRKVGLMDKAREMERLLETMSDDTTSN